MSLLIDVIENLTNSLKTEFIKVIETLRKEESRQVRKISDTCIKFLDYGELRYDKMEDGIKVISHERTGDEALHNLLLAVMNDALDENETAMQYFVSFCESSASQPFSNLMNDFITVGKAVTSGLPDSVENAGLVIIERYAQAKDIAEILSNFYLKFENESCLPVFQRLAEKALELYPENLSLYSLKGFVHIKAGDYQQALAAFNAIKDKVEPNKENAFYHYNMASTLDNIAGCYLKMGDAEKTLEACDLAAHYDEQSEGDLKVGNDILYKKADALILTGRNEESLLILNQLLALNPADKNALAIKKKIAG